jgi:O-antigen ligase
MEPIKTKTSSSPTARYFVITTMMLAAITIPLHNLVNSWALLVFFTVAFFVSAYAGGLKKLLRQRYWILTIIFFIWLGATWFWDTTGGFSMKYLESYSIFVFLPFILAIMPRLSPKELMMVCTAFVGSIIVVCAICLVRSYIEYRHTGNTLLFFYHYLGYQMGLNAIYLSNYCIACITWVLYYKFIYAGPKPFKLSMILTIIICFYFFLMVFLLSSKMSTVILIAMLLFLTLYIGYRKKVFYKSLLVIAIIGTAAALLANNLYYFHWRIEVTKLKEYSGPGDNQNGLAARIFIWHSALNLIKEKPVLGYGLKGAEDELIKQYQSRRFEIGIPDKYNSHNQYMETTLKSGIIGLALMLAIFIIPLLEGIRQKKLLLVLMVIHFMIVSLVEGTLEMQQEIIFYCFFIFAFYYYYRDARFAIEKGEKPEQGTPNSK